MINLYLDIETVPCQRQDLIDTLLLDIKPPGNLSKQETIEKWWANNYESECQKKLLETSFNGAYGEILSIAWAVGDEEPKCSLRKKGEDEALVLNEFYDDLEKMVDEHGERVVMPRWVGHWITGFDLRFLWQRSVINAVKPSMHIPKDAKPWDREVFDTKVAWTGMSAQYTGTGKLSDLIKIFGGDGKDDFCGADVYQAWIEEAYETIKAYNIRDVEDARFLYKRFNFLN
jgi:3'-5' exonuclease